LRDRKKLTTYLNSKQKLLLSLPTLVRATKKSILLSSVLGFCPFYFKVNLCKERGELRVKKLGQLLLTEI